MAILNGALVTAQVHVRVEDADAMPTRVFLKRLRRVEAHRLLVQEADMELLRGGTGKALELLASASRIESGLFDTICLKLGELLLEDGDRALGRRWLGRSSLHRAAWLLELDAE
ncbi:MAG: hypothetical protein IID39_00155 [Planctomycetes bacterium]|nr:hypothetical protein [Planctomycetota bacterium]